MLGNGAVFSFTGDTSQRLKNNDKRKELMQSFAKLLARPQNPWYENGVFKFANSVCDAALGVLLQPQLPFGLLKNISVNDQTLRFVRLGGTWSLRRLLHFTSFGRCLCYTFIVWFLLSLLSLLMLAPPLVLPQPLSCYIMLCYAMLCHVVLRYVLQRYGMLREPHPLFHHSPFHVT